MRVQLRQLGVQMGVLSVAVDRCSGGGGRRMGQGGRGGPVGRGGHLRGADGGRGGSVCRTWNVCLDRSGVKNDGAEQSMIHLIDIMVMQMDAVQAGNRGLISGTRLQSREGIQTLIRSFSPACGLCGLNMGQRPRPTS